MDCCLCSSVGAAYRPPRNTICASCFEGARAILNLSSRIEQEWRRCPDGTDKDAAAAAIAPKGLMHAFKQMEHLELMEDAASEKLEFLESLVDAFREGIHTDVELVTNDGQSVRAHRVVLATKSSVFKIMFEVDQCKGEHSGAVVIHELNRDQLQNLLEFLYCADLPEDAMARNAGALLVAADKYDIPVLSKVCEAYLANTVSMSNVLEMLELATLCSAAALKDRAIKVVLKEYEKIVFSKEYEDFAIKNAQVAVELTKALIRDLKK